MCRLSYIYKVVAKKVNFFLEIIHLVSVHTLMRMLVWHERTSVFALVRIIVLDSI